jgi:hypothetical protein
LVRIADAPVAARGRYVTIMPPVMAHTVQHGAFVFITKIHVVSFALRAWGIRHIMKGDYR